MKGMIRQYGAVCGLLLVGFNGEAATTTEAYGIAGGQGPLAPGTPYAALISPSGVATALSGPALPVGNGIIVTVAMNDTRYGIIGGRDNGDATPYAALVSPTGVTTALTGPGAPVGNGIINSVAINRLGQAIIGGVDNGSTTLYGVLVSPAGVRTAFSGPAAPVGNGFLNSVAINDSGNAIVGGIQNGNTAPYIVLVSPTGVRTALSGGAIPVGNGEIFAVDINNSGNGIAGGTDNGSTTLYAALVSSSGATTALSGPAAPVGNGRIVSAAINESGNGIIGGRDNGNTIPYAALFSSSGVRTALSGPAAPTGTGEITDVAINSSGNAIIGGRDNATTLAYMALVSPTGVRSAITGDLPTGTVSEIKAVAIADSGIALVGGAHNQFMMGTIFHYLALVSPSGVATNITGFLPSPASQITSVRIADVTSTSPILAAATPSLIGPGYGSPAINAMLFASQALSNHADGFNHWRRDPNPQPAQPETEPQETALLAESDDVALNRLMMLKKTAKPAPSAEIACVPPRKRFSIWIAPFYANAYQKDSHGIPSSRNQIPGAVAGFEYWTKNERAAIGAGLGYAYDDIDMPSQGTAKVNEGMATLYASYAGDYIFANAALWGGYYWLDTDRRTLGIISSKGDTHGWLASPHLELCFSDYRRSSWAIIEPFLMGDWVNNWQKGYTEKGASGLNLVVPDLYNSLLRAEGGLGFYQILRFRWGRFIMRERASFINKTPFHFNPASVAFVGSASSFSVTTGTNRMQNLAGARVNLSFLPWNEKYPYGQLSFLGEFNRSYQSYFGSFEIGKYF